MRVTAGLRRPVRVEGGLLVLALLIAGCRGGGSGGDTGESTDESGGQPSPDACASSTECDPEFCVAPWDPEREPPRGPTECVSECVGELDLQRFCIDDASCCEGLICAADGLCEPPFDATESGSDTDETSTDTGSSTDETDTSETSTDDTDSSTDETSSDGTDSTT